MGSSISQAAATPPPPPPDPAVSPPPSPPTPVGLAVALPPTPSPEDSKAKPEKVHYKNLPCPVPFEDIKREANMSLNLEFFEGLRFDFNKGLNQKFYLSHSVFMGSMEVPTQSSDIIKVPTAHYAFAANYVDPKLVLLGRVLMDGRLSAQVMYNLTDNLVMKIDAQLMNEPHYSAGVFNFEYKGKDCRTQFQFGNDALYNANYIQVATGQVASTGSVALSYVQKVSEKFSLASEFMYNPDTRDATASFGYDHKLRQVNCKCNMMKFQVEISTIYYSYLIFNSGLMQCRLRGKIDTNGCVGTSLEEQMNMGFNISLSAMVRTMLFNDDSMNFITYRAYFITNDIDNCPVWAAFGNIVQSKIVFQQTSEGNEE
ncbi:Mitochondrial import receptor subunit TOM40-1 [Acorus calamus]|uniref:Mitochondrial import receptor subunit TOM40-1 n=1 Tax=Acorus calamus TaxID=4465 RepID=A0AAV9D1D7_ACOCL|nr:Mitochondrial import receptor subunit TOM40-1 [Acorus calamus]